MNISAVSSIRISPLKIVIPKMIRRVDNNAEPYVTNVKKLATKILSWILKSFVNIFTIFAKCVF